MAELSTIEKLGILADAAKYDASCASSGTAKRTSTNGKGIGSTEGMGICHAYAPDGRCISLLKILLTNHCIFDCHYCINRKSSNVRRARFTPREVADLTLSFYRRNYIELVSSGLVTVFGDIFTLVFIVGAMLWMDWRLALVTFAVLPIIALVAFVFRARIRDAYREIRVRLARINAFLQERLSGVRVVQLFGREREESRRFEAINRDHLDSHLRSITYYALFFPAIELLTAVALALILWYGGGRILEGTLTVGTITAFFLWARRFFRPIQDLSEKYNILQGAMASSERIFQLLDTEPQIRDHPHPLHLPRPGRGEIEFRGVWFRYGEERGDREEGRGKGEQPEASSHSALPHSRTSASADWVLRGVDFRVTPGGADGDRGGDGGGEVHHHQPAHAFLRAPAG